MFPARHRIGTQLGCRCRKTASVVGAALLMLLVAGAMGPHLVHHLCDAGSKQTCLLSAQASHFPGLAAVGPSVVPIAAVEPWKTPLPAPRPQAHLAVINLPRAPPSPRACSSP